MDTEKEVVFALSDLVLKIHKSKQTYFSHDDDYEYLSIEYEGPYIDEDTGETDENCLMYLVSVDEHLSNRIDADDKEKFEYGYDSLYAWVYVDKDAVDIVGMSNFYGDDRLKLVKNLSVFLKHYG